MKRIKMLFATAVVAIVSGIGGTSSASAGQVDIHIYLTAFSTTVVNCDATFTTTGGPPQSLETIVGSSLTGTIGSPHPCVPADVAVPNNPKVSFSGTGPFNAVVDRFTVRHNPNNCDWSATNIPLTGWAVNGPYFGSKAAPSIRNCWFVPGNLSLSHVVFH